jgi:tetratricopeptide (TPR) repeat protein
MTTGFPASPLRRLGRALSILFLAMPLAQAADVSDLVDKNWIAIDSPNFRVVTEQPEDVARQMIVDLENLRYISNRVRGAESLAGPPLTIVAMGRSSYATLGLSRNIAGVFQLSRYGYAAIARIDGYATSAAATDESRSTILHEYHHFLLRYSPETVAYPRWYNEGMSEYWSSLVIQDGKAWFGHPVEGSAREDWLVDRAGRINLDTKWLFNTTKLAYDSTRGGAMDTARFYAQAKYAIHYFNSAPELRRQLAHYLRLYNMGLSEDQAVHFAFKKTYKDLDVDMRRYVERRLTARGFSTGKDGLDLPPVEVKVAKLDRAATYAVLADVVPRFTKRDLKVARELIETNLKLHPDDPKANSIAVQRGVVADGGARLDALSKRYPNDAGLLATRAEGLRMAALTMHDTGTPGWEAPLKEARDLYRRAIQADPANSLAYFGLGNVYMLSPDIGPVQEGIGSLDSLVLYEPSPRSLRALASLYLRNKQLLEAVKSIRSAVAFDAEGDYPLDALFMENLELLADMASSATPNGKGLRYTTDAVYEGTLAGGKPDGKGKWMRPTGSYYEGDFVQGLPSGHGKLVSERGVAYEGEFAAGMARGTGRISFPAGAKMVSYEGGVADAAPAGAGVLVTKDGRLEATFVQGQAHGDGVFVPARGTAPIRGKWLYGAFQWPAADKLAFVGGIDGEGRRSGPGWCQAVGSPRIDMCFFKDDRQVPSDTKDN